MIPRGSARTAGIPACGAASIRAAIPAGPGLQPRRGNAERDDDDNAVQAWTTPTGIRTPGPAPQAETPGSSPRPPVIGITCLDCRRFGTPDDPGHQQLREHRAYDATSGFAIPGDDGSPLVDWDLDGVEGLGPALAAQFALAGGPEIAASVGFSVGRYQMTARADLDRDDGHLAGHAGSAADQGASSHAPGVQPHGRRIGQPSGERG